jgi:hypothetical protein
MSVNSGIANVNNALSSWNKMLDHDQGGYAHQKKAKFGDYEKEKLKINERAKRQIVRKYLGFLQEHRIMKEHFLMLQNKMTSILLNLLKRNLKYSGYPNFITSRLCSMC